MAEEGKLGMTANVFRQTIELVRDARVKIAIEDTLSFVEDVDFIREFYECGLDDDDLELLQTVLTICPMGGDVVPVSRRVRDAFYGKGERADENRVAIRYVYLESVHVVLLLTAYPGSESLMLTEEEAQEAESLIDRQEEYFSLQYKR